MIPVPLSAWLFITSYRSASLPLVTVSLLTCIPYYGYALTPHPSNMKRVLNTRLSSLAFFLILGLPIFLFFSNKHHCHCDWNRTGKDTGPDRTVDRDSLTCRIVIATPAFVTAGCQWVFLRHFNDSALSLCCFVGICYICPRTPLLWTNATRQTAYLNMHTSSTKSQDNFLTHDPPCP